MGSRSAKVWYHNYLQLTLYRPATQEELFNLQHARAWNVIERAFGVIKWCFKILGIPPEYSMDVQCDSELGSYPGQGRQVSGVLAVV